MPLTPNRKRPDARTSPNAVSVTRRGFLDGARGRRGGLGRRTSATRNSRRTRSRSAFIGTGDEGSMLLTQHPPEYMDIVADRRPAADEPRAGLQGRRQRRPRRTDPEAGRRTAAQDQGVQRSQGAAGAKDRLGLEAVVIAVPLVSHARHRDGGVRSRQARAVRKADGAQRHTVQGDDPQSPRDEPAARRRPPAALQRAVRQRQQPRQQGCSATSSSSAPSGTATTASRAATVEPEDGPGGRQGSWKAGCRSSATSRSSSSSTGGCSTQTGGGLMAELGSHQLDAASIFLGKVHPLAVQGYGGKNFYGVKGVGSQDKQEDDRGDRRLTST